MNKRKKVLFLSMISVFFVVFNLVFFVTGGFDRNKGAWLAYSFILFAYIMLIVAPFLARKNSSQYLMGLTLGGISFGYFVIEFCTGLLFISLNHKDIRVDVTVQVILAGVFLIMLFATMLANEHTSDSIERREDEVSFIKDASSRIRVLVDKLDDKRINRTIEQAYDFVHSSPSRSCNSAKPTEKEVLNKIDELAGYVMRNDSAQVERVANEIVSLMEERNRIVRSTN